MDLLRRRNLMQGGDAPVFVDWIEFSGQEFINTHIVPSSQSNASWELEFQFTGETGDNMYNGAREEGTNKYVIGYDIANNSIWAQCRRHHMQRNYDTERHIVKVDASTDKVIITYDGYSSSGTKGNYGNGSEICIGALDVYHGEQGYKAFCKEKVRSSKIWINGVLAVELHPCFFLGQYGLWDTIEGKFHGNASGQGAITGGYDE